MIDRLSIFAAEVTRVAREVGTKGEWALGQTQGGAKSDSATLTIDDIQATSVSPPK
jgi:hypothetical protein